MSLKTGNRLENGVRSNQTPHCPPDPHSPLLYLHVTLPLPPGTAVGQSECVSLLSGDIKPEGGEAEAHYFPARGAGGSRGRQASGKWERYTTVLRLTGREECALASEMA